MSTTISDRYLMFHFKQREKCISQEKGRRKGVRLSLPDRERRMEEKGERKTGSRRAIYSRVPQGSGQQKRGRKNQKADASRSQE